MRTKYIDTTDVSFHGVRSVGQSGTLFQKELIQGFQSRFHCVFLDLKDLPSRGIVTYNN